MEELILTGKTIFPDNVVQRCIISDKFDENKKIIRTLNHIESPYRIAKKAFDLNKKGQFKEFYSSELFRDLIENGAIDTLNFVKITNYNFEILAGFVFESFISRRINSYDKIKKSILEWILSEEKVNKIELDNIKGIVIGSLYTKEFYPDLYSPNHPNIDIIFLDEKKDRYPPVIDEYNRPAGVQVKAVKTNYKEQIVRKVVPMFPFSLVGNYSEVERKHPIYRRVLTLLKDDNGKHSYEICRDMLYTGYKEKLLKKEMEEAIECIICPEKIGIDQEEVDYYYMLIRQWHNKPNDFNFEKLGAEGINSLKILNSYIHNINENLAFKSNIIIPK